MTERVTPSEDRTRPGIKPKQSTQESEQREAEASAVMPTCWTGSVSGGRVLSKTPVIVAMTNENAGHR